MFCCSQQYPLFLFLINFLLLFLYKLPVLAAAPDSTYPFPFYTYTNNYLLHASIITYTPSPFLYSTTYILTFLFLSFYDSFCFFLFISNTPLFSFYILSIFLFLLNSPVLAAAPDNTRGLLFSFSISLFSYTYFLSYMYINVFLHSLLIRTIGDLSFTAFLSCNSTFLIYFCYLVLLRTNYLPINSYTFYTYFSLKPPVLAAAPDIGNSYFFHGISFLFFYTPPSLLATSLFHYPYSTYSPLPSPISIITFPL